MKTLFLAVAFAFAFASAPAFAACHVVAGTGDHPNHQSSLSSTTEGGVPAHCVCS